MKRDYDHTVTVIVATLLQKNVERRAFCRIPTRTFYHIKEELLSIEKIFQQTNYYALQQMLPPFLRDRKEPA